MAGSAFFPKSDSTPENDAPLSAPESESRPAGTQSIGNLRTHAQVESVADPSRILEKQAPAIPQKMVSPYTTSKSGAGRAATREEQIRDADEFLRSHEGTLGAQTVEWVRDLHNPGVAFDTDESLAALSKLPASQAVTQRFLLSNLVRSDGVTDEVRTEAARIVGREARDAVLTTVLEMLRDDSTPEGARWSLALGLHQSASLEARAGLEAFAKTQNNPNLQKILESPVLNKK